ncbi:MAG: hypothetical protein IJW49_10920 [Clostridia bacterium]|nr:hypothetical protein [Clostridia bacterium]
MAMRHRFRRHRMRSTKKIPPIAIVGIVLVGTFLITIIIGNLLRAWLDDETYQNLINGDDTPAVEDEFTPTRVRNVYAYPFTLGGNLSEMVGQTSASVCLNTPSGKLTYTSPVGTRYSLPTQSDTPLTQSMADLCTLIPYVSGVFYPQALNETNESLRYAATNEECALLHEFITAGGGELLICGLPLTADRAEASITYLKAVKKTAGSVPVGVAVPYEIATDQANWELLARLLETVDFCALDLTAQTIDGTEVNEMGVPVEAKELFDRCSYAISAYSMRPLFEQSQEALITAAIITDKPTFQVIRQSES